MLVFKQNKYRKYIYLLLYPVYLFAGLMRVFRIIPKKYYIFGAGAGFAFIDNTKYAFLDNLNNKHCIWICHSKEIVKQIKDLGIHQVALSKSIMGLYYQIMSKMVIISHGTFDVLPPLLCGTKVFQYWHGIPIKKIGIHVLSENKNLCINKIWGAIFSVYPHLNNYYCNILVDCSKNGYCLDFNPFHPKIIKNSYPRWDSIMRGEKFNAYNKNEQLIYLKELKAKGKKIILYLPTYRDEEYAQKELENNLTKLATLFSSDEQFTFVYKSHFVLAENTKQSIDILHYKDSDPYPLLTLSSGLITDYSSIGIDYLLLNKPIQFFVFDRRTYEKHPGCYFDLDEYFDDLISINAEDVYKKMKTEILNGTNYSDLRNKVTRRLIDMNTVKSKVYDMDQVYQNFCK